MACQLLSSSCIRSQQKSATQGLLPGVCGAPTWLHVIYNEHGTRALCMVVVWCRCAAGARRQRRIFVKRVSAGR